MAADSATVQEGLRKGGTAGGGRAVWRPRFAAASRFVESRWLGRRMRLLSHLRCSFTHAARHFFRRHILFVRSQRPGVAERIGEFAVAVAPEHVGELRVDFGAGGDRFPEGRINVIQIQEHSGCSST